MSTILNVLGAGIIIIAMLVYAIIDTYLFNKNLKEYQEYKRRIKNENISNNNRFN